MSQPPSPTSEVASFPPPPRSLESSRVHSRGFTAINAQDGSTDKEDVLLTSGKSRRGVHSRRTPVVPSEEDEQQQHHVNVDAELATAKEAEEKGAELPVLANFLAAMHRPQLQSFKRGRHPVTELVWKDLTIKSRANRKSQEKTLLNHVDGKLSYGLTALMGPSGSGKTTLLNCLACRLDVTTTQEGELWLNGEKYSNAELKRVAGYVMQDDLLNGYLTVRHSWTTDTSARIEQFIPHSRAFFCEPQSLALTHSLIAVLHCVVLCVAGAGDVDVRCSAATAQRLDTGGEEHEG